MDAPEGRRSFFETTVWKPKQRQNKGKFSKGKPQQHSDEIGTKIWYQNSQSATTALSSSMVRLSDRRTQYNATQPIYSKGTGVQTIPSLSKQVEGLPTGVIGLQYVWEYRSPSLSVAPLYHCKVCNVHQFQSHMIAHISGWKHSIRYIKKDHPDKIPFSEEDVVKDPTLKKTLKEVTAELATTVGKGQLKVILKEPFDVPAFKGLFSASQKHQLKGGQAAEHAKTPRGSYQMDGFGGYASMQAPSDYSWDQGQFYGSNTGQIPEGNEYGAYEQGGPSGEYQEYSEGQMNPVEQPQRHDGADLSNTLLGYLDTFKIENENDAQLVLKVTQKLTDVLMEYRLRPKESSLSRFPLTTPKLPQYNTSYSGYQAPSRYSGTRNRF